MVRALLPQRTPSNDEERRQWINRIRDSVFTPPAWWKLSENISGAALIGLLAVITFFVVKSSGLLMTLLYGLGWGILILYIVFRVKYARKSQDRASPPA